MTSLSDTLTVGLVLVLLFGSIALYLYTRVQQAEQKLSLLESILLDLKMSSEIKSYTELPADNGVSKMEGGSEQNVEGSTELSEGNYVPFDEEGDVLNDNEAALDSRVSSHAGSVSADADVDVNQYKSVIADAVQADKENTTEVSYEAMTLKELQTLAKTRGITGAGSMKKGAIIEALKTSDRATSNVVEPGSVGLSTTSFLETSSAFAGAETQ